MASCPAVPSLQLLRQRHFSEPQAPLERSAPTAPPCGRSERSASPLSHHSVGVQPVKAATARNDRGESQPRVVWGIRRPCTSQRSFLVSNVPALQWNCHRTRKRPDVLRPHRSRTTPKTPGHEVVHRHCSHACRSRSSRCRGANDSSEISLSLFGMLSAMAAGLGYAVYAHTTSVLISRGVGSTEALASSLLSPHSYSVRSLSLQSSRAVMSVGCGRRVA